MRRIALWITGLPGSGKSTIADAVKACHPGFTVLRMDELRSIVTPEPSYSDSERELAYRSLVYLAKKIMELGHNVIIDATGNKRRWRDLARRLIPEYAEIYLRCPVEECMEREGRREEARGAPRGIYKKGREGWPVPGLTAPYEEPVNPELVIETGSVSVDEAVSMINDFLAGRLSES